MPARPGRGSGSEERREQVGQPSHKLLPRRAELVPVFGRKVYALLLVVVKHVVELLRGGLVHYNGVFLVVPAQAP